MARRINAAGVIVDRVRGTGDDWTAKVVNRSGNVVYSVTRSGGYRRALRAAYNGASLNGDDFDMIHGGPSSVHFAKRGGGARDNPLSDNMKLALGIGIVGAVILGGVGIAYAMKDAAAGTPNPNPNPGPSPVIPQLPPGTVTVDLSIGISVQTGLKVGQSLLVKTPPGTWNIQIPLNQGASALRLADSGPGFFLFTAQPLGPFLTSIGQSMNFVQGASTKTLNYKVSV